MAPLSWRHHTLVQALLTRGPLSERDFHAVFAGVSGKNPGAHLCACSSLLSLSLSLLFARRSPTSARRNAPVPMPPLANPLPLVWALVLVLLTL
jgi:hypothetical protein